MHLDTDSPFLGYTYVADPDAVAKAVIGGTQLKRFKSTDGRPLTDAYLVERLSQQVSVGEGGLRINVGVRTLL